MDIEGLVDIRLDTMMDASEWLRHLRRSLVGIDHDLELAIHAVDGPNVDNGGEIVVDLKSKTRRGSYVTAIFENGGGMLVLVNVQFHARFPNAQDNRLTVIDNIVRGMARYAKKPNPTICATCRRRPEQKEDKHEPNTQR